MPVNPQKTLLNSKIRPFNPEFAPKRSVALPAGVSYLAGQVLEEVFNAVNSEVQTVTVNGSPTGGTFVLGYPSLNGGYDVTVPIAYNAPASTVQTAISAVVGAGNVVVTGSNGGPWTLTYGGEIANQDVAQPVLVTNSLTGGSAPTVAMATSTPGSNGAVGVYQAYSAGIARAVLEANTKTDFAGRMIDEFGSADSITTPAYIGGDFLASVLIGVDATAVPNTGLPGTLGRLIQAQTITSPGAIIRIGG